MCSSISFLKFQRAAQELIQNYVALFSSAKILSVAAGHCQSALWCVWMNFCTRICARMRMFLLAPRETRSFHEKSLFSLVNRNSFEMKSDALKSLISES